VTVVADETRNEGGSAPADRYRGREGAEAIEHGHSSPLHDAVRSKIDRLKHAEVHEGHLLVQSTVHCPLGACGTQGTVEDSMKKS
jgi:hypothetical protein